MSILPAPIVAKLDGPKYIANWRDFLRLNSTRWNISGILVALGYSTTLAAGALPFRDVLPHVLVGIAVAAIFIGSMWSRLRSQPDLGES